MITVYRLNQVFRPEALDCRFGVETLAIIGTIAAAAGTGASMAAAADAADQQKKAAEFNSAVASNNAVAASQQAKFDSERLRDRNRRILAAQQAAFAKNGLLTSGSVLDVGRDSRAQGELEVLSRQYSGAMARQSYESQSAMSSYTGNRVNSGLMVGSAAASGLSGVVTAASNIPRFRS